MLHNTHTFCTKAKTFLTSITPMVQEQQIHKNMNHLAKITVWLVSFFVVLVLLLLLLLLTLHGPTILGLFPHVKGGDIKKSLLKEAMWALALGSNLKQTEV